MKNNLRSNLTHKFQIYLDRIQKSKINSMLNLSNDYKNYCKTNMNYSKDNSLENRIKHIILEDLEKEKSNLCNYKVKYHRSSSSGYIWSMNCDLKMSNILFHNLRHIDFLWKRNQNYKKHSFLMIVHISSMKKSKFSIN